MINDLFSETWKELKCGIEDSGHPFKVCALASLEESGKIKQRMLRLRKITHNDTFLFYTDARSFKVQQLKLNPYGSVIFYHPLLQLQVSICGKVVVHEQDEIYEDHKLEIEGRSVQDYNTKSPPGKKIKNPIDVTRTRELHFSVIELIPEQIDYLKLRAEPNRLRATFTKTEEGWDKTFLVP
ncbi:pyridoxamine 5'-phosphate oxidase family protein [Antarcticibacterium sp. 1MA-6-2]|uniref:pyridoxamine 5'-phosphate oxidase family protein n=1 Tax=Antarcticibacterium sp. 1MA-6-2 TaxID=2908210 RepID=UPI001F16CB4D|nr:pyridoxamine 5'-phosphate oxidase family protein [Antarcticibacterium sp. 1MA-6-2]UJH92247.1 pyridoxamine 5'-phosphate oxidase family protein [Antarcticibacterium sp. 1MA-6-2]